MCIILHRYGDWKFVREVRVYTYPDDEHKPAGTFRVYIKHCKGCGTPKTKRVRV